MIFYTQGLTYPEACQLSDDLKAAGIDSNIVTGALAINALRDEPDGSLTRWDDWTEDEQVEWTTKVGKVVNGRCGYSSALPFSQQLVVDRESAIARLREMGVYIEA